MLSIEFHEVCLSFDVDLRLAFVISDFGCVGRVIVLYFGVEVVMAAIKVRFVIVKIVLEDVGRAHPFYFFHDASVLRELGTGVFLATGVVLLVVVSFTIVLAYSYVESDDFF